MLTVRVGHDTDYLTEAVAKGREGYYTGAVAGGEPPGLWYGQGAAVLGLTGEVDAEVMKALYTHGLDPRDPATAARGTWGEAARLGNAPRNYQKADEIYARLVEGNPDASPELRAELRAQAGRAARQSVAFYDVVLSAPKSMTVLWVACERAANDARAAGDHAAAELWASRAKVVEEGLLVGHRAVLDFYAEKAGYARAGHHGGGGGRWVDGHGLIAAQFLQHDSRDKDPQLHVHGPVANKVQCADGKWRALDGTLITGWRDGASAVGERVTEAYVWRKLGARWETRPDGKAREIVGVDGDSMGMFSKRTAAITPAVEALLGKFRAEVGREPTGRERSRLADQATLATRRGKSCGGETRDGQIARWAVEHSDALGVELGDVAATVFAQNLSAGAAVWSERDVVQRALAAVAEANQSWTRSNLLRAVGEALPGNLGVAPRRVRPLMEGLADKAEKLARHLNPRTGPAGLEAKYYRADGCSVFVKPGSARYATDEQLLGEAELRAAAVRRGAPVWSERQAWEVVERFARCGRRLGVDQAAALRGILTSGAAVEVLAAPAGTGKSFLVGTLAETWTHTGCWPPTPAGEPGPGSDNRPRVFGVAYGQRQADVLTEEGVTARNITAWLGGQERLERGAGTATDEVFRVRRGDLLVVDEAGAADTAALVAIHRRCAAAGVKLLLVGDPKQLGAVGAGGALGDMIERGISYELAEVRRFHQRWEGPASLRLRDGDTSVVGEYAKHGRLIEAGTLEQAEAAASRAWLADTLAGREALLVVGSNDAATRVSNAVRAELVRLGRVQEVGVALGMQATVAGVGDLVQARRNAWHLQGWAGNASAPINRATYRVIAIHPTVGGRSGERAGGLTVARVIGRDSDGAEQLAEPITLPGSYVNTHVTLAYASTVHAAQGRTVDAGYGVLGAGSDAASAYVQMTRGRDTNVAFMVTRTVAEGADTGETHTVAPRTASDVLTDVIRPPEVQANRTALTEAEDAAETARATGTHLDPLIEVIGESLTGRVAGWLDQLAAAGVLPEHHRVAFAADDARGSLEQLLRAAELAGHDPAHVLRDAVTGGSLDKSASVAQVLHFRIRTALKDTLAPRVAGYVDLLPRHLPEPARTGLTALAVAADARRIELGAELSAAPPQWAREALGPVPAEEAGRAEWQRRAGWAGSYRELVGHTDDTDPLGAAPPAGLAEKHALFRTAHNALDLPYAGADEETLSEGRLRNRVAAYAREEAWAPRYVADELEATHTALHRHRTDATVWAARAEAAEDPHTRSQHQAAAAAARDQAEGLEWRVRELEMADDARGVWWVETAVTRDNAERARVALGLRGIDLDVPAERVTAQEWLDAHEAEQRAAEADRNLLDEHDLYDHNHDYDLDLFDRELVAGRRVHTIGGAGVPDIRESSVRDAGERVDPTPQRRVPLPDETAVTVQRAQRALIEIEDRRVAEAAETARTAALEREEDLARREELLRWTDHDTTTDPWSTDHDHDLGSANADGGAEEDVDLSREPWN
jgi:conjugative relaxase-like TrwC/TraI family protein